MVDGSKNVGGATKTMRLSDTLRADFNGAMGLDGDRGRSMLRRRIDVLMLPGFWAVLLFRISQRLHARGLSPLARIIMLLGGVLFSCELWPAMQAGPGLVIPHPQGVTIGVGVVLGSRVRLLGGARIGTAGYRDRSRDGWPVIGDDCVVCDGSKVFGPVHVGDRSVVGTSVVLFESVPPDSIVALRQNIEIRSAAKPAEIRQIDIG